MIAAITRLGVAALLAGLAAAAHAADTVTVGAIYPLTGGASEFARLARPAIETAAEIVDQPHEGLEALPLGAGRGLPHLAGARIAVAFGDDLANPSVAQSQAMRLIGSDRVAALIGAGETATTLAAAALAERRGVPFVVPDATAPGITARGFKAVFRTTPLPRDAARRYAQFLAELKRSGTGLDGVALMFEDSDWGRSAAAGLRDALTAAGLTVAGEISYPADAADLAPQINRLRDTKPDAVILASHLAAAMLAVKTMQSVGYKPPILLGEGDGFVDPEFVRKVGNLAQWIVGRSAFAAGKPDSPAAVVNELFKAKTGHALDDTSARVLQGFLVLADAIDRAGSAQPAAIQAALRATDLKPDQLVVGYDGVKFDETGQNTLAGTYLTQLQGNEYVAVWPKDRATGTLSLPYRGWK